jgi:hypothetical protein
MPAQEDPGSSNVIDQPKLPPQGRARTAVIAVVVVMLLIVAALFLGLAFSRPGGNALLGAQHQKQQFDPGLETPSRQGPSP